ncbi:hypothetical protein V3C99_001961 [Haemonchus contortus]
MIASSRDEQRSGRFTKKEIKERGITGLTITEENLQLFAPFSQSDEEIGMRKPMTRILFDDGSMRNRFVRKVFIVLAVMLLVSIAFTSTVFMCQSVKTFILKHLWLSALALGVFIVTYFILICFHSDVRYFPLNITMVVIFTLALGFLLMILATMVPAYTLLLALLAVTLTCGVIVVCASYSSFDITSKFFILFSASLVVLLYGVAVTITDVFIPIKWLGVAVSVIVCLLFMIHSSIYVQKIIRGHKYKISPDEYIYATLVLFIDAVFISSISVSKSQKSEIDNR